MSFLHYFIFLFAVIDLAVVSSVSAAAPIVVTSIKPIASLVEGVMGGVGKPYLIVASGRSLHTFSLKPSDAQALHDADIVFWVGAGLENFLQKPIVTLASQARVVELAKVHGVELLNGREGGVWESHIDDFAVGVTDHADRTDDYDGHIWLDPRNAKVIVSTVQAELSKIDTLNAPQYAANAAALSSRLDALDAELSASLAQFRSKPFVVFHDGYQYFEKRYGLDAVGSLTVSPDRMPGARRVTEIREKIKTLNAVCIFAEPQFEPRLVQNLAEGTNVKVGSLDAEASTLSVGPDLYFDLMRGLAANLRACFS